VEGVATDGKTIWVSSVLDRQILACGSTCRTLATLPAGLHPFAIAWDATRRRLWVAADCPVGVPGIKPCDRGALIALSASGRLMTRIAPLSGTFHPGDVSAAPQGVFVSDSQNGAIYRLANNGYGLSPVIRPSVGKSAQGTALDAQGKSLLFADYGEGIGVVDLTTGARTMLPRQDGKPSVGIDGLARCGDSYFGVYNGGAAPPRIWRIRMRPGGIERTELVEGLTLSDPTQIAFDGKRLLFVSESGWELAAKNEKTRQTGAQIMAIPLGQDCNPQ
jgi:hypothetical protein